MELDEHLLTSLEIEALARRIDRSVVLVGMMGVGKTTVGRKLAATLHMPFAAADEEIEEAAQLSISEIFERHGEPDFRDGERRVIARLIGQKGSQRRVIATGGGAFCNPGTRALILERAITVWIDSDIDVLVERTSRRDSRPLLRQGNPRETLTRLKIEREQFYSQAPIHVTSGLAAHTRTVALICKEIAAWL